MATICGTIISLLALGTWSAGVATAQPIAKGQPQVAMGFVSDPRDSVGGVFVGDISTEYCQGGYLSVGRGTDDRVWYSALSSENSWSSWAPLAGTVGSSPVLYEPNHTSACWLMAAAADRRLQVALITADQQNSSVSAAGWSRTPAELLDSPVVSTDAAQVFVRGLDGAVWSSPIASTMYNPYGGWSTWSSYGGQALYAPAVSVSSKVSLSSMGSVSSKGSPCVTVVGGDRQMWRSCSPGGRWTPLGGVFAGSPAATAAVVGGVATTTTVGRGLDGAVWCRSDSHGWTSLGGRVSPDPMSLILHDDVPLQVGALVGDRNWVRSIDPNCGSVDRPYADWTRWLS